MIDFLNHLLYSVPLELFVFIGTFIDEVIAPIPAFIVLVPAGIAAHVQGLSFFGIGILGIISAFSRTIAGLILYSLSEKLEGVLYKNDRRFLGTSHKEIVAFGKKLSKQKSTKSWVALFVMHAMPVFPGVLLSVGSGFIRLRMRIFLTATFFGSLVSAMFFLYIGYAGLQTASLLSHLDTTSQIVSVGLFVCLLVWVFFYHRSRIKK